MQIFDELKNYAKANKVPIIRDESADFLLEIARKSNAKNILEIGTAIGYSGTLLLNACPNANLTTIEINEQSYKKAIKTFEEAGISEKVKAILGDAKDVLIQLIEEKKQFDFIFMDGPKGQYVNYLSDCKKLLKHGGVIFADNVFLHGLVNSNQPIKHKHRAMVTKMRKFLEVIQNDAELEVTIFNIEDGIAVLKKK